MNIFETMAAKRAVFWLTVFCFAALEVDAKDVARKFTNTDGVVNEATMNAIRGEFAVLLWNGVDL